MSLIVYLDQNTLSDLRQRKIDETNDQDFKLLKHTLKSKEVSVVYSHVTLNEIQQISVKKYQEEHIELLCELDAIYIDPLSRELSKISPRKIWLAHQENNESNERIGITDLMKVSQLTSRKISGLPITESFEDINNNTKSALNELISNCEEELKSINLEELPESLKEQYHNILKQIPEIKANTGILKPPVIDSEQLGPLQYREIPEIKVLEIESLDKSKVVKAIESIFEKENSEFDWNDYFEDTPHNAVIRAYSLMNWVGYHADDFDKVKKRSDRFNASNNDMQHAAYAIGVDFLISSDNAFCKKAEACYSYTGSQVTVSSPRDFLKTIATN